MCKKKETVKAMKVNINRIVIGLLQDISMDITVILNTTHITLF